MKRKIVELAKKKSYCFTILFKFGGQNDIKMKLVHTFSFFLRHLPTYEKLCDQLFLQGIRRRPFHSWHIPSYNHSSHHTSHIRTSSTSPFQFSTSHLCCKGRQYP